MTQAQRVEEFVNTLNGNRQIILTHRGERYKARSITDVLYSARNDSDARTGSEPGGRCPHCGEGAVATYVACAGGIVFLIEVWEGCMTYDPTVDVTSFNNLETLRHHFLNTPSDYSELVSVVFGHASSSSSSSSTDSY